MTGSELAAEGWRAIENNIPPRDQLVEFARDERVWRQPPWFGRWGDIAPEFNVAGLLWRPVD